jgi:hypothetical protein
MANKISVIIDVISDKANKSLKGFKQSVNDADGALGKLKAGGSSAFASLKANSAMVSAAVLGMAATFAVKAVGAASDLEESMNAVDVTFGKAAESIHALGETSVESFGLSRAAFNSGAVSFAAFAQQVAGPGGDVADVMSDLMTRAVDFASVMNLDLNTAMTVFQSTLAGEAESMRRYGKDVSAAAVTQYALEAGLVASKSEMNEAIKVQARYGLLMRETSDVAGDFENTSGSLANQQKKLSASLEDTSATLGKVLIPVATEGIKVVGALVDSLETYADMSESIGHGLQHAFNRDALSARKASEAFEAVEASAGKYYEQATDGADSVEEVRANALALGLELHAVNAITVEWAKSTDIATSSTDELADVTKVLTSVTGDAGDALARIGPSAGRGAEGLAELKDEVEENIEAVTDWAEDVKGSTESGAESFGDFSEEALKSIGAFQEELNTTSADVNTWQQNLITVAASTSPEFAGYLAEMGLAGAGLVEELANNEGALETTLANYELFAAVTSRDMVAEFAAVAPGVADELAKVETEGVIALELARDGMMVEARRSKAVGTEIGNGVRTGLHEGAARVAEAATTMVSDALAAVKNYARIKSPSRLFADEVGQPIAQGVADGVNEDAYKLSDAITDSIEGAEENAVRAAKDLSDAVLAEFQELADGADAVLSGLFGEIDSADRIEGLGESVSDAEQSLADAQQNLAEVRADETSTRKEIKKAVEAESDAQERLRDANMALTEATIANTIGTDAQYDAWLASAEAAGLTVVQIRSLEEAYKAATVAQQALAVATANHDQRVGGDVTAIAAEAGAATKTNDRFREAGVAGLVMASDYEALGNLSGSPKAQLALMEQILARIEKFFAGGAPVATPPRAPSSAPSSAPAPTGPSAASAFTINVTAGMGANGPEIGSAVVSAIKKYERKNGTGWRAA